ncbi:L-erythro-3,5-diaminohexanoate dehydrogenase [Thermosipho sp. 1063]|uniref:L-erythro-3,5-diaminohexanoate dehydrogenase n=1 Tax=unclassified Thermosipho (in: thermotogales) TaxID=2676525 RepID=UPI0009493A7A|nr:MULTISPECIES: L-erythro-3,5-diaminohexanoate dehydrogenase [unclassified Thermosipho (in: thermotogales)]ANQ53309.1 L-erythro-3,5-diaminohexanoate dehydrogenase [Thermosipho sp. 1070]APT71759.1 L-erythro-3,5-diaminohexanoate dehydrogenase [Thermosipho sp. 1063]OOC45269.1 L-erythro-3,5-diaminohexanoate dehydrogenase [Thermosipho sp. 1074]
MINKKGCPYGTHRVIEPEGFLPQAAKKIDNNMEIYSNEILIDVKTLNVDSASFTQIKNSCNNNIECIKKTILSIVKEKGKLQNPLTGSGGMLIGTVKEIGKDLKTDLKVGDKIATLVSLSLTPLKIDEILDIKIDAEQVDIKGKAILFETGIYAKLPDDIPEKLALAVLDVAGAPAQVNKLVKPGMTVAIIGGGGKSGILCTYQAMKNVGKNGKVIVIEYSKENAQKIIDLNLAHHVIVADATKPVEVYQKFTEVSELADVTINNVNVEGTEMSSILITKDEGIIYFFSMATSFTRAALGAEGVGKDVTMIIGNGYTKGHAQLSLNIIRESNEIRKLFESKYC